MTKKQADAELRRYGLEQMRKKNPKFSKRSYYKIYKELGGRLTYAQAIKKPRKKDC
jgi:hypothetical protein